MGLMLYSIEMFFVLFDVNMVVLVVSFVIDDRVDVVGYFIYIYFVFCLKFVS